MRKFVFGGSFGSAFPNVYSMIFDGVDEGCSLATKMYNGQTKYSWSCWVKFNGDVTTLNNGVDWARNSSKYNGFALVANELRFYIQGSVNGIGRLSASANITSGAWLNLVWVYDGGGVGNSDKLKLYINGVAKTLIFTGTIPPSLTSDAFTSHKIPNDVPLAGIGVFNGNLDEVAHWSGTSLSEANALTIYNSGKPNDLTTLSPSNWWRFGDGGGDSNLIVHDQVGVVNLTGINLEITDIVTDVP